jgi:hypothetical protein
MPEKQERTTRKVGAWVPPDLYDNLKDMGYFGKQENGEVTQTDTIIEGLKLLLEKVKGGQIGRQGPLEISHVDDDGETRGNVREMGELRAQVKAQQEHIETLKIELDRANKNADDIKGMYDKHVLQVQTLINQQAIEAPGAKKKRFWEIWK